MYVLRSMYTRTHAALRTAIMSAAAAEHAELQQRASCGHPSCSRVTVAIDSDSIFCLDPHRDGRAGSSHASLYLGRRQALSGVRFVRSSS